MYISTRLQIKCHFHFNKVSCDALESFSVHVCYNAYEPDNNEEVCANVLQENPNPRET